MGVAQGVFVPLPDYKEVQPVFRLYAEAGASLADQDAAKVDDYYKARDALGLYDITATGECVATECVHIDDYSKEIGEMEVSVIAADAAIFRRYFEMG
jgi:hypothetical protein